VARLRFTRQAREDLLDRGLYVAPRNSEAIADRVQDHIEQSCQLLKQHP
jgi:plasmid stabilization system protein ParE